MNNTFAQDVVDFHQKFKIQYDGPPCNLPPELAAFRNKRAFDEVQEIADALEIDDREMVLDGIIDSIYILLGTAHLCGFTPDIIAEAWRRVHEANMQKELVSDKNPSPHGALGGMIDIVKPPGWVHPKFDDLLEITCSTCGASHYGDCQ